MLFHISEEPDIERFDPRPSEYTVESVVWAIDADRLRNYLVPRECPRVTFYAGPQTTTADKERFLRSSVAVMAVAEDWLTRVQESRLYCYHVPPQTLSASMSARATSLAGNPCCRCAYECWRIPFRSCGTAEWSSASCPTCGLCATPSSRPVCSSRSSGCGTRCREVRPSCGSV
jgi:hypothetical protein